MVLALRGLRHPIEIGRMTLTLRELLKSPAGYGDIRSNGAARARDAGNASSARKLATRSRACQQGVGRQLLQGSPGGSLQEGARNTRPSMRFTLRISARPETGTGRRQHQPMGRWALDFRRSPRFMVLSGIIRLTLKTCTVSAAGGAQPGLFFGAVAGNKFVAGRSVSSMASAIRSVGKGVLRVRFRLRFEAPPG